MSKAIRAAAVALALVSVLFFVYGCMKLVQSQSAAPPSNVEVEVPGVNVQVVDVGLHDRALAIVGVSSLTFLAGVGVGLYTLRPARSG